MADSRGSRCREDHYVNIYLNGVLLQVPRKDSGFTGETHLFTTETNLIEPTYAWSLDGWSPPKKLLGSNSSYAYTFDNQKHRLSLMVTSIKSSCSIGVSVEVTGKGDYICPIKCKSESVNIPAGIPLKLVTDTGATYFLSGNNNLPCTYNSEEAITVAQNITHVIRDHAKCEVTDVSVVCFYNFTSPNCNTITITNSPFKFKYLVTDKGTFSFNTQYC